MQQPLKHLTVIELASVLAGPAVGLFFAELGARVIKIESPKGDLTRSWKLSSEAANEQSAYYSSVNWNKEVQFVNLKTEEGKNQVYELIKEADIVITNYKAGDAHKLGMEYETLKKFNPQIIYGHINGFGEGDTRTAFDVVLQAESGLMYMNGTPDSGPVKMPIALIDILAAHQLKEGLLIALLQKSQNNQGAYVSASLAESAIASLSNQATNWLMAGHIPQAMGSLHPNIAPYGELFLTKDNHYVVLAVGNDTHFANLCKILNLDTLIEDPKFSTNINRVKNRAELSQLLEPSIQQFERDVLLETCQSARVPIGAILNMKEVFETPLAKEMILKEVLDSGQITQRVKTSVFKIR